jgi:hypothetical protein
VAGVGRETAGFDVGYEIIGTNESRIVKRGNGS